MYLENISHLNINNYFEMRKRKIEIKKELTTEIVISS